MRNKVFIISLSALLILGFSFESLQAGSGDNVSGFAWSDTIGWISFNNTSGGGGINYGMNIDTTTGVLSGYAWSENVGWISFNRSDTGAPPGNPYQTGTYIAQADLNTREVSGWARVLANDGGWDGWIKLRCYGSECNTSNYGVSVDTSVSPAQFRGWAWSANSVLGWVSFNCSNQGCGASNYKVVTSFTFNLAPTVSAQSPTQGDYCDAPYPPIFLSWTYSDPESESQSAYQVVVDNNSDFSSPISDSGKVMSSSNTLAPLNLPYDSTLYWRVKAWDGSDNASAWSQGAQFTTQRHAYPSVSGIISLPANPRLNQNTSFSAQVTVYDGVNNPGYSWTFQDATPGVSGEQGPTVQFNSVGQKQVNISVTDSDNFSCSDSTAVSVQQVSPAPQWQEAPPISWIRNIISGMFVFLRDNIKFVYFLKHLAANSL